MTEQTQTNLPPALLASLKHVESGATRMSREETTAPASRHSRTTACPTAEPLQYRLITAPGGRKMWCLIHPNALPDLKRFKTVRHGPYGRLGAADLSAGLLKPIESALTGHRAPLGLFEHPRWGEVIAKGREADLSEKELASLNALPNRFSPLKPDEARLAQRTALWVSRTSVRCGIPTVPVHLAAVTEAALPVLRQGTRCAGLTAALTAAFWKRAGQLLTFQPYILDCDQAADLLDCPLIGWDEVTPEISDWLQRIDARLEVFDSVSGAPDRHSNNMLQMPVLLPGGEMTDVRHGIDYELISSKGWLNGDNSRLQAEQQRLNEHGMQSWERAAIQDVLSQMHTWDSPPSDDAPTP